uniref:Uncharacterized protein n=1 Tax=Sphaerodactylus townsendi TaxID=933632 RepID=A0ACB8FZ90_9SAUR
MGDPSSFILVVLLKLQWEGHFALGLKCGKGWGKSPPQKKPVSTHTEKGAVAYFQLSRWHGCSHGAFYSRVERGGKTALDQAKLSAPSVALWTLQESIISTSSQGSSSAKLSWHAKDLICSSPTFCLSACLFISRT